MEDQATELSRQLQKAVGSFQCLTDCTEVMLRREELLGSDSSAVEARLLCHLLRHSHPSGKGARDGPTHIFIGVDRDGALEGRLYFLPTRDGEVEAAPAHIPASSVFSSVGETEAVSYANVPADPERARLFQEKVGKSIRRKVRSVQNYVATRSGPSVLIAFNFRDPVTALDREIVRMQALHVHFFSALAGQIRETEGAFRYLINALARAAEVYDPETGNHILRVNRYAECLARELGLTTEFVDAIGYLAQLHDVGKIHIDQRIVRKSGRLEPEEVCMMREHTTAGAHIIGPSPRLAIAREIALTHHERWDGSGYPVGLRGEAIPLSGRIVAIADIYDALRSGRPYKPAYSHVEAMTILQEGDGRIQPSHFDPRLLAALQACHLRFASIYEELKSQS